MTKRITVEQFLAKEETWRLLIGVLEPKVAMAVALALSNVESYVHGAALQQRRLDRSDRQLAGLLVRGGLMLRGRRMRPLF